MAVTTRVLAVRLLAALVCAVVMGSAAASSVFRWVDKNGVVHYDDTSSGGQKMTREYLDDRKVADQPEWAGVIPGEFVAEVQQRCSNATERLANYRSAPQIYGRDPSGNVYPLSPTQAKLMLAEIQTESESYCRQDAPRRLYSARMAALKAERGRQEQPPPRR